MKHYGKRLLAMLLALALCLGLTEGAAYAQDGTAQTGTLQEGTAQQADGTATADTREYRVSGDGQVGSMIAAEIGEQQAQQEAAAAQENYISALEVYADKGQAAVRCGTAEGVSAEVVVAVYEEGSLEMALSGKTAFPGEAPGDSVVAVDLGPAGAQMPEYFTATAYLLDAVTHAPLGKPFTTQLYTQEMQKLQQSTVEDYEKKGAQVLNLDDDGTTNFAVYTEDTTVVEEDAGTDGEKVNDLRDNGDGSYTVYNADESVTGLQPGDPFSYNYEDGTVLLVKVKETTQATEEDGSVTVTVTGDENAQREDYFEYIKIETDGSDAEVELDTEHMEEGLELIDPAGEPATIGLPPLIDKDVTVGKSVSFKVNKKLKSKTLGDKDKTHVTATVSATGEIEMGFSVHLRCYLTLKYAYLELGVESSMEASLSLGAKVSAEFPTVPVKIILLPKMVELDFTPKVVVEVSGKLELSTSVSATKGFIFDSDSGFEELKGKPEYDAEFKAEGEFKLALKISPKVVIIKEEVGEASIEAVAGVTVSAEEDLCAENDHKHECSECYAGEIGFEGSLKAGVSFIDGFIEAERTFASVSYKLADFYYSVTHDKHGWGTCPYIRCPVTVKATKVVKTDGEDDREPVCDALITVEEKNGGDVEVVTGKKDVDAATDENGEIIIWLKNGTYTIHANSLDYHGSKKVTVKDKEKSAKIEMKENTYKLTVHAQDEAGEPMADVTVSVPNAGKEAKTDESGTAELSLGSGTYDLTLRQGNYIGESEVTMDHEDQEVTVTLKKITYGTVRVTVYNGGPVSGVEITSDGLAEPVITEADGVAEFRMKAGTWTLLASSEGFAGKVTVTVTEDSTIETCIYMEKLATLHLTVVDDSGKAMPGIEIHGLDYYQPERPLTGLDGTVDVLLRNHDYFQPLQVYADGLFGTKMVVTDENQPYYHKNVSVQMKKSNVYYTVENDTLHIFGNGAMEELPDGSNDFGFPWSEGRNSYSHISSAGNYKKVVIDRGITTVRKDAFAGVSEFVIPDTIKKIGERAFANCGMESMHLPEGLTEIGDGAFENCSNLREIQLPDSLESIGAEAFSGCEELGEIVLPSRLKKIEDRTFFKSGIRNIKISEGVMSIGESAFADSSLKEIDIPEGVTSIGESAFADTYLEKVVIPASVTAIGDYLFYDCNPLEEIYFKGHKPEIIMGELEEDDEITAHSIFYINDPMLRKAYYPEGDSTWDGIDSETLFNYFREFYDSETDDVHYSDMTYWYPYDPATLAISDLPEAVSETATEQIWADAVTYDAELALDLTDPDAEAVAAAPEAESADGQDADAQDTIGTEPESGSEDVVWAEDESETGDGFPAEDILAEEESGADAADMSDTVDAAGQPDDTLIVEERTLEVFATGDATGGTSGQIHSFSGMPNMDYLFVEVVSAEAANLLAPDNLLYIAQGTTDETGAVSFDCRPRGGHGSTTATQQLFGPSDKVITEADVTIAEMTANGEVQYPDVTVTYTDKEQKVLELAEDDDYTLSGGLRVVKAGDYTLTVTGIGEYSGTVTKSFTVKEQGGTVKPDDPTDPTDPTGPTDPSTGDHDHVWEPWETVYEADVFFGKLIMRRCSICKKSQTRYTGQPVPATISLSATSFPLRVKQSYKVKVSGLAKGDSVKSWKSSNPKVAKVSGSGKITGKKKGKATITVRLMSGLSRKITVKVQTGKVKTKKINVSSAKVTLTKGGTWKLAPAITPVTSQDKAKYTSSNKKVATVSKKGVIKAKKPGKAKITIRSGKKKKVVTVTVTN